MKNEKQTLVNDIDKLEKTIAEVGKQQEQLQANMFCTTWCSPNNAINFLEMFNEENEKDG